jgi:hypothetical protein
MRCNEGETLMGPKERELLEAYQNAHARIWKLPPKRRNRKAALPLPASPPSPPRRVLPELPVAPVSLPPLKVSDIPMIRQITATFFGLSPAVLLWPRSRLAGSIVPRQIAMYLAHDLTGASTDEIGEAFNRDRSTVIYSLRKLDALLVQDNEVASTVALARARVMRFFFEGGTPWSQRTT